MTYLWVRFELFIYVIGKLIGTQCYDQRYWVPFTNMKFWRNLLLSDCSRTITWACCCKPSVNHVNLAPHHYESHVIKWSELSLAMTISNMGWRHVYIYVYVFERGAGVFRGNAPALPPPTTGGGLPSAGENIIVIMWSWAENECVRSKSVRDPTSITSTWTHTP
jgi:hypothetical protein